MPIFVACNGKNVIKSKKVSSLSEEKILALIIQVIVFFALIILKLHERIMRQQFINPDVVKIMRLEQFLGIAGIIFLIIGYVLQLTAI